MISIIYIKSKESVKITRQILYKYTKFRKQTKSIDVLSYTVGLIGSGFLGFLKEYIVNSKSFISELSYIFERAEKTCDEEQYRAIT